MYKVDPKVILSNLAYDPKTDDLALLDIQQQIKKFGRKTFFIAEPDVDQGYLFTVGNHEYFSPELIMFSMASDIETHSKLINSISDHMKTSNKKFSHLDIINFLNKEYIIAKTISEHVLNNYAPIAGTYYAKHKKSVEFMQIFSHDGNNHYPFLSRYDSPLKQPLLFDPAKG